MYLDRGANELGMGFVFVDVDVDNDRLEFLLTFISTHEIPFKAQLQGRVKPDYAYIPKLSSQESRLVLNTGFFICGTQFSVLQGSTLNTVFNANRSCPIYQTHATNET
jgi:hypothetical protein